jgi:hypothetical protein
VGRFRGLSLFFRSLSIANRFDPVKKFILLFLWFGLPVFSSAQTTEIDDSVDERIFLLKDLEFFIDTTNSLTFSQISGSLFEQEFKRRESYQNKDYQSGASYWIRFSVKHNPSEKVWLIEFYDQTIDLIEAYVPKIDGTYNHPLWEMDFRFINGSLRIKISRSN